MNALLLANMLAQAESPRTVFSLWGGPWITHPLPAALTHLVGYVVTLVASGPIVRFFVTPQAASAGPPEGRPASKARFDPGAVIGKCENIIAVTLVLLDQLAWLAIIFAAKSLVRKEKIEQDAGYYLGGTLVNLVWSVLAGMLLRMLVLGCLSLSLRPGGTQPV
jgi:hypothetical protein